MTAADGATPNRPTPEPPAAVLRGIQHEEGAIVTEPATVDERVAAITHARGLLTYLDHSPEDLLVVADWLLTGQCDAALAFAEQRARHYTSRGADQVSLDAASWSPLTAEAEFPDPVEAFRHPIPGYKPPVTT